MPNSLKMFYSTIIQHFYNNSYFLFPIHSIVIFPRKLLKNFFIVLLKALQRFENFLEFLLQYCNILINIRNLKHFCILMNN